MRKNWKSTLVYSGLLLASVDAIAQEPTYNPSWYLVPTLGKTDPDSGLGLEKGERSPGIRFGKPVSEKWDVQFGANYVRSDTDGLPYRKNTWGVDGLYLFSRNNFRPFLLVGAGTQPDRYSGIGNDFKILPYVNAGIGFQYSVSDRWVIQADLRHVCSFMQSDDYVSEKTGNNAITIGFNYAFGGLPSSSPSQARLGRSARNSAAGIDGK